jgi:Protein of unknown function (DUF1592)/Protein of unknown function (DUF1588)/Protein of unknown function (DUF1585)/Protein of unknown function (DUF1587)/Protein of unknown function (DUF1595)
MVRPLLLMVPMRHRTITRLFLASTLLAGCSGLIGGDDGKGGTDGGENVATDPQALCDAGLPNVGTNPLRRLTRVEYNHAVVDLLEIDTDAGLDFVPDDQVAGFYGNSVAALSEGQVEELIDVGEELAQQALAAHQAEWFTCDVAETACVEPWIRSFSRRAFRRASSDELHASLVDFYDNARDQWGADKALEMVVTTVLASPHFIYHFELTPAAAGEVVALTGYEVASRMAFFLWQSLPDEALLDAAEAGSLDTPEGIEAEARRMLASDKARDAIESYHEQWLELGHMDDLVKDTDLYPAWNEQLADSMKAETLAFVQHVVDEGLPATELLTADYSFVDGELASLYGAEYSGSGEMTQVTLPGDRAGLLTQGSFLASRAHAADTSWVLRGKFIREKLLCQTIPAPPPNVAQATANDPDRLTNPACKSCHIVMDPVGLGFENYGPIGEWRDALEDGTPIDGDGEFVDDASLGTFSGPVDLANKLAAEPDVLSCMTTQWFRYATRRFESEHDECAIEQTNEKFAESGYDIRELLVAVSTSDVFRHRRGPQD